MGWRCERADGNYLTEIEMNEALREQFADAENLADDMQTVAKWYGWDGYPNPHEYANALEKARLLIRQRVFRTELFPVPGKDPETEEGAAAVNDLCAAMNFQACDDEVVKTIERMRQAPDGPGPI